MSDTFLEFERSMRRRFNSHGSMLLLAGLLLEGALPQRCHAEVKITANEQWTNVFAEEKITFHFTIEAADGFQGRAVWSFAATNGRIYPGGRGEAVVNLKQGQKSVVKVPLNMPTVKAGVVLPAVLTVSAVKQGQSKPESEFVRELSIFFKNPFADRSDWLKKMEIHVFDSAPDAPTIDLLKKMDIPHEETRNPAALEALDKGLLLIGEGVSFRDERGLDEIIAKLAARGLPVICLAPKEGMIRLPGTDEKPLPERMRWRNANIIIELDKRLDASAWAGTPSVVATSLKIKSDEGRVVGEVSADDAGWPWLEVDYTNKGTLLVIGFPIVGRWESSPTPRYLFARLLEYVSERPETAEKEGKE